MPHVNSETTGPSFNTVETFFLEKSSQAAVRRVLFLLRHLMMLSRQKEIFPIQVSLEVLLQTFLQHVQNYPSKCLQAESDVRAVSSRLSLLLFGLCWCFAKFNVVFVTQLL